MRQWIVLLLCVTGFTRNQSLLAADELSIDLKAQDSSKDWLFLDKTARIENGELIFDGRQKISRAVYLPREWGDVTLTAKFFVEPQPQGVLACGFMVRAVDGKNYYYIHFDRGQAILVRHSQGSEWNEIKRIGGLEKPAGQWHEGQLECRGNTLRVSLNGKLLYEAKDDKLAAGRIGFYGSQGLVRVKDIRASGPSTKPAGDFVIPPPDFVHVCEDAGAGGYEAFPDVCRLNDGRLMCVFYAGYGHIALPNDQLPKGGRISYCLSSDEGHISWFIRQVTFGVRSVLCGDRRELLIGKEWRYHDEACSCPVVEQSSVGVGRDIITMSKDDDGVTAATRQGSGAEGFIGPPRDGGDGVPDLSQQGTVR